MACAACKRQYDATKLAVGSRFRCRCGNVVTVERTAARDAEVVRCASCGAPREAGAKACAYCGSDFTVHEQDLDTICPSCLARISDRAKFCSHCGAAIAPEDVAAEPTDRTCPACGEGRKLASRSLGDTGFAALECGTCAGLWLGNDVFEALEDRARKVAAPDGDPVTARKEIASRHHAAPRTGAFYRPCPVCRARMNRLNFDKISGIILDRCAHHGLWFDATELESVLRWIKIGGEHVSAARQEAAARARISELKFKVEPKAPEDAGQAQFGPFGHFGQFDNGMSVLPWIVRHLLRG